MTSQKEVPLVLKHLPTSPAGFLRRLCSLLVLASGLAGALTAAAQQTYEVANANASGPGSFAEAVQLANADPAVDQIVFAPSLANERIVLAAAVSITAGLLVDGAAAPRLSISGGWDGAKYTGTGVRLFEVEAPGASVTFRNIHLTEGYGGTADDDSVPSPLAPLSNGGVFYLDGGQLVLEDCLLTNSTAYDGGFIWGVDGDVTALRTSFLGGRARDDGGVAHMLSSASTFSASACTFYNNMAGFAGGGANSSRHLGAAFHTYGVLALSHCTVAYNSGPRSAININSGQLRTTNSLFTANDNGVDGSGGAYANITGGSGAGAADFAGGTITQADGNYSDNDPALSFFNLRTADEIALGPLIYDSEARATAAIDCRSVLRDAIASTGTDQRGTTRGANSEPGARELTDCVDRDGDGIIDYADTDDDADGVEDARELSFVKVGSLEIAAHIGTGSAISPYGFGSAHPAAGTTVNYFTNGAADATLVGHGNVRGGAGFQLDVQLDDVTEEKVVRLSFAHAVYGLSFSLTDLDLNRANSRETVEILLLDGDHLLGLTAAQATLGANVTRIGNRFYPTTDQPVDGRTSSTGSVTVGPLDVPVTGFSLRITGGTAASASPAAHRYYLTEPTFHRVDSADVDGDGLALLVDVDSDGDGVVDIVEAQTTTGFNPGATGLTPIDTDGDGVPDFQDEDSDDDGEYDVVEAHDTNNDGVVDASDNPVMNTGLAAGEDLDQDGLDDGFDNDPAAYGGGFGNPNGGSDYPNHDANDFDLDFRDVDGNVAGYVWHDTDGDGIRDLGEDAIASADVRILDANDGSVLFSGTTGTDGRYLFVDVDGGFGNPNVREIRVQVPTPGGFGNPSAPRAGADRRIDSDIDPNTNRSDLQTIDRDNASAFVGAGFLSAPVPVDIYAQRAYTDADCRVEVSWSVGTEHDTDHYRVEQRLQDGAWQSVAQAAATGRAHYTVHLPDEAAAGAYLRITDVDQDGSADAGPVMRVGACLNAGDIALAVAPNPTRGGSVQVTGLPAGTALILFDATGRRVASFGESPTGVGTVRLQLPALPAGIYVLRAGQASTRLTVR